MVLVVVTCALRTSDCLRGLIEQVDRQPWGGERLLVSDGPPAIETGWPTHATAKAGAGQMRTYWRALGLGVERARRAGSGRFLVLEDDVELSANAMVYIDDVEVPQDHDFLTWFDGHAVPRGAPAGIYAVPTRRFYCLQGVTWKIETAERLLASRQAAAWTQLHRGDHLVRAILAGGRYGVHVPNLVEHRGIESICTPGRALIGPRLAANYAGRDFDCLSLRRPATSRRDR